MKTPYVRLIVLSLFACAANVNAAGTVVINPSDDGALYVCTGCNTVSNGGYVLAAGYIQGIVRFPTAAISGTIQEALLKVNPYGLPLWDKTVEVYGIDGGGSSISANDADAGVFLGILNLPENLGYGQDATFNVTNFLSGAHNPYVGFNLRTDSGTNVFSSIEYNYGHPSLLQVTTVDPAPVPESLPGLPAFLLISFGLFITNHSIRRRGVATKELTPRAPH
jgi:hypothetical protein